MKITILVGSAGSGKSTWAGVNRGDAVRISQDDMGKEGHWTAFEQALGNKNIVIDRMNFDVAQRNRYLNPARELGYETEIVVFHVPLETCLARCNSREGHPTIKNKTDASKAVNFFFSKYERVQDSEADKVTRLGWMIDTARTAIICDLDGTLANLDHRLHFMKGDKKNWAGFFGAMKDDTPNEWCVDLIEAMRCNSYQNHEIIYATGRPSEHLETTQKWLTYHNLDFHSNIFSRMRGDYRSDTIIKEIILEFELKTRVNIAFVVDDRKGVVDMWRSHGLTVLHCAEGDF